jgi:hypothetical protein
MRRSAQLLTGALVLAMLAAPTVATAQVTPFSEAVNDAIDNGLAYLRAQQRGNGRIGDNNSGGGPTGLAALCFLERRASADFRSPAVGYVGMDAADQERVRNAIRYCINDVPGLSGGVPYSYTTGSCLMALSVYLVTGGPDDVGAGVPVSQALANGVAALRGTQAGQGGWNYTTPSGDGDLSTTQFAMAGLSAAAALRPEADDPLPNAIGFVNATKSNGGGHRYRSNSGIWTYRLGQRPTGDANVQSAMQWLQQNYRYDSHININGWNSQYYYMWAAAKALEVTHDDGSGNFIFAESIGGVRDPAADGFPEESPRWYYDYAWQLIQWQLGDGSWCGGGTPNCWDKQAATAYAILVLQRSLGGVCLVDDDMDELCSTEDNCPEVPNPDQADRDGDGVGDVCDNCPDVPNLDQIDDDADGIGDICDDIVCVPDGNDDICDGTDNDCDGAVDEAGVGDPNAPARCATGQPGICAAGRLACLDGSEACIPDEQPEEEVCDGYDNNCDGVIDEDLVNDCGRCGPTPAETCNGEDDDCDGTIDEGELCEGDGVCVDGGCREPCAFGECANGGEFCHPDLGVCVTPCVGVDCPRGTVCNMATNACDDPCAGVNCGGGDRCWLGECVPDDCVSTGCDEGSVCNGVECVPDPCVSANCAEGEFCRGGQCIPTCAQVSCALYSVCVDGDCVEDPCGGIQCADGSACNPDTGECEADPCGLVSCGENTYCDAGECVFDPCAAVECIPGQICEVRQGAANCVAGWVPPPRNPEGGGGGMQGAGGAGGGDPGPGFGGGAGGGGTGAGADDGMTGGGFDPNLPDAGPGGVTEDGDAAAEGCACDASGGGSPALWLLLLPALGLRRRRRG